MKPHFTTISTPRLLLLDLPAPATQAFFEAHTLAEAQTYFHFRNEAEAEDCYRRFHQFSTHNRRISFQHFLLYKREGGPPIGDCCFHLIWRKHQRAEIGYGIWREADRRQGYMKEALAAVLQIGFDRLGLSRIEAFTSAVNQPSMCLLRYFGFHREGLVKRHYAEAGEPPTDSISWGLLPENFQPRPPKNRITALVNHFEQHSLPLQDWNHEAHLTTGLWYICRYGLDAALCKMRTGIITYNSVMGAENTPDRGYHETLTVFWMKLIHRFIRHQPTQAPELLLARFMASPLADAQTPFQYYTRERLLSTRARGQWVAPDLKQM